MARSFPAFILIARHQPGSSILNANGRLPGFVNTSINEFHFRRHWNSNKEKDENQGFRSACRPGYLEPPVSAAEKPVEFFRKGSYIGSQDSS